MLLILVYSVITLYAKGVSYYLYKFGNKLDLLPSLYYLCGAMKNENYSIKPQILNYARNNGRFGISQLVSDLGMNINTVRQYLSALARENRIVRISNGEYMYTTKQTFRFIPSETLKRLYNELKEELPYTDFCIYDGGIFTPLQHHVSVNHAIYVETNRDTVDTVFSRLKDSTRNVYKQPDAAFMYDYVNLQEPCVIVKTFVTESPVNRVDGIITPTIEKLLIDIQKDDDLDYMRGTESLYMFRTAFDLYVVNIPRLLRYAKRRGAYESTYSLITQLDLI